MRRKLKIYEDKPVDESKSQSSEDKEKKKKVTLTQWAKRGDAIVGTGETMPRLEAGRYRVDSDNNIGPYITPFDIKTNKLFKMPNEVSNTILSDVERFWTLKEQYKKYNRVYRRNYLLYSAPGTGKTSIINIMCDELIKRYDGIVIYVNGQGELEALTVMLKVIRDIEPDRKIIAVMEDIDNVMDSNYSKSILLNLLDGYLTTDNLIIIATTNYIEKIDARIKNRPSRFNRVMEFPLPNKESRKMFIEKSILPEDLEKIDINLWVSKTDGFTIDHINELIQLHFVFGESEEYSFTTIRKMVEDNNNLINESSVNAKKIGFTCEGEDEEMECGDLVPDTYAEDDICNNKNPMISGFSIEPVTYRVSERKWTDKRKK